MAINGKVYNVTAYLPFHPGGEKEMMRGVGRDGTKLFSNSLGIFDQKLMDSGVSCLG